MAQRAENWTQKEEEEEKEEKWERRRSNGDGQSLHNKFKLKKEDNIFHAKWRFAEKHKHILRARQTVGREQNKLT